MKKELGLENKRRTINLLKPSRPFLCTTKNEDNSDNVAPFSWIMPISQNPPRVAFAVQNERGLKLSQTLINILREHEFVINIPVAGQEEKLIQSSHDLVNYLCKFDRTGFTRDDSRYVKAKMIKECSASLECRVYSIIDTCGDHTLVLADVVNAVYDAKYYDDKLCPKLNETQPIISFKGIKFDDHEEHIFIKTMGSYSVTIPYEKADK